MLRHIWDHSKSIFFIFLASSRIFSAKNLIKRFRDVSSIRHSARRRFFFEKGKKDCSFECGQVGKEKGLVVLGFEFRLIKPVFGHFFGSSSFLDLFLSRLDSCDVILFYTGPGAG